MAVEVKSKISSFDIKYRITSRLICKQILPDICFNQNDCEWGRITAVWRLLKFSNTKFYKIPSNILIQSTTDVVRLLKNRIINHRIFDRKKYVAVVTKAKKNILEVLQSTEQKNPPTSYLWPGSKCWMPSA